MSNYNGVIEKSTGYLLRVGYTDFTASPDFDSNIEEQIANPPQNPKLLHAAGITVNHWDNSSWSEVAKPALSDDEIIEIEGSYSIDCSNNTEVEKHYRLIGNTTLSALNACKLENLLLLIEQDNIGGHTLTWDSDFKFPNGSVTLSTLADKKDLLEFKRFDNDLFLSNYQIDLN